jgi:hypothetical protein
VGFLLEAILQELKDNTKTQIISILPTLVNLVKFTYLCFNLWIPLCIYIYQVWVYWLWPIRKRIHTLV